MIEVEREGSVVAIDNLQLARLARLAGAPMVRGAGVDLHVKVGDAVKAGQPLYTIYADFGADFQFSLEAAERRSGFTIG